MGRVHCKKRLAVFPSPAWMSLNNRNNLTISGKGEIGIDIPPGDGKTTNLFLQCNTKGESSLYCFGVLKLLSWYQAPSTTTASLPEIEVGERWTTAYFT
jgi:hypothetical protein